MAVAAVPPALDPVEPEEAFEQDLADLRAAHKAKRNFVKLLDGQAWA